MTNEEAIIELRNMQKYNYTLAPDEVFDMAIEALENYDGVAEALNGSVELYRKLKEMYDILKEQKQWIPCSERLPEVGEDVFISVGERVCEAHLRESKDYFLTHKIKELVRVRSVDAWMPLPKPWEGGTE